MTVEELKESILEKIYIKLDCITNQYLVAYTSMQKGRKLGQMEMDGHSAFVSSADDQVKTSEVIKNLVESYAMLEDSERV